jgi:hypothetical protein
MSAVVLLIRQWLEAGVMEDGTVRETLAGTPQGGVIRISLPSRQSSALGGPYQLAGRRSNRLLSGGETSDNSKLASYSRALLFGFGGRAPQSSEAFTDDTPRESSGSVS